MPTFIAFCLLGTSVLMGGWMFYQYSRGLHDLLTLRNLFLCGLIYFQFVSASVILITGSPTDYALVTPETTAVAFAGMLGLFTVSFLASYSVGLGAKTFARIGPTSYSVPPASVLWLASVATALVALFLRFGVAIPYIGVISQYVGVALAAVSAGIAGWIWARQLLNPALALPALTIIACDSLVAISGTFGRRNLLAVGGCMLWGMYYSKFRYQGPKTTVAHLAVLALLPLAGIALFTSVRDAGARERGAQEYVQEISRGGDLKQGIKLLLPSGETGTVSLWLVENHPERFARRPLFTLSYLATYMVPRAWWPEKPEPLSVLIPEMAKLRRVAIGTLTIGPGIIGHAAAEGGWYAALAYGVFFGFLIRLFDEVVRANPFNPLIVLPIGGAFGHVIGMPRGETAAFAFIFLVSVATNWFFLAIMAKVLDRLGLAAPVAIDAGEAYDEYETLDLEAAGPRPAGQEH